MNTSLPDIAIRVKQLSKQYAMGGAPMDFRAALSNMFKKQHQEFFWALKDVSFDVKQGEIIGVIGENGSGKSTLLKILSGITKPTTGRVEIYGRIASILDIGAGFHPDLTGRENIYLKGQLLGMSAQDITQHYEEIVAFSELNDFINMPIKHYSDGMFLRLAFSSLLHLDADILLLDEVLSVGDTGFQLKSIERIHQIAKAGKTILLVSHQPQELITLCTGYLHLEQGKVAKFGHSAFVLQNYLHTSTQKAHTKQENDMVERFPNMIRWKDQNTAPGNELFRLTQVAAFSPHMDGQLFTDEAIIIEIIFQKLTSTGHIDLAFSMNNEISSFMISHPFRSRQAFQGTEAGTYRSRCIIPANLFNKGHYQIGIFAAANKERLLSALPNVLSIHIESRVSFGPQLDHLFDIPMPLMPVFQWELHEPVESSISFTKN